MRCPTRTRREDTSWFRGNQQNEVGGLTMKTPSSRVHTAHHPSTRTTTAVAAVGPLLLAVGWILTSYLPDSPLWIAAGRVLPAGLILLALRPARPSGVWWHR